MTNKEIIARIFRAIYPATTPTAVFTEDEEWVVDLHDGNLPFTFQVGSDDDEFIFRRPDPRIADLIQRGADPDVKELIETVVFPFPSDWEFEL